MMTRKPAAAIAAAWPYLIQLVCALEKKPWISTTGRPSPSSRHAIRWPSKLSKKRVSVGELATQVHPFADDIGEFVGALVRQVARVAPALVPALDSEMSDRAQAT